MSRILQPIIILKLYHASTLDNDEYYIHNKHVRHCVKSVQMQSYFWSVFSCIWIEYGDQSPHSIRMQENTEQK